MGQYQKVSECFPSDPCLKLKIKTVIVRDINSKVLAIKSNVISKVIIAFVVLVCAFYIFLLRQEYKLTDERFLEKVNYTGNLIQSSTVNYLWQYDLDRLLENINQIDRDDDEINFIEIIDADQNVYSTNSKKNMFTDEIIEVLPLSKDEYKLGLLRVSYSLKKKERKKQIVFLIMIFSLLLFGIMYFLIKKYVENQNAMLELNEIRYRSIFKNLAIPIIELAVRIEKTQGEKPKKRVRMLNINQAGRDLFSLLNPDQSDIRKKVREMTPKFILDEIINFDSSEVLNYSKELDFKINENNYFLSVNFSKYYNREQAATIHIVSVYDLTPLKEKTRTEQQLQRKIYTMQRLESLGKLAGGIAHDFNNILSTIMGYVDFAKLDYQDKQVPEYVVEIERASMQAKEIVKQVLSFGNNQLHEKKVMDICNDLTNSIGFVRAGIPDTVEIKFNICDTPLLVKLNPSMLSQIILNLCTNSYHAMSNGLGVIKINLYETQLQCSQIPSEYTKVRPGKFAVLSVSDDGNGISPDHLQKIFDPYFTTKSLNEGVGLGLSLVYGIVTNAGGFIKTQSKFNEGTTFQLFLPACHDRQKVTMKKEQSTRLMNTDKKRIIFLDDNESVNQINLALLKKLGFEAHGYTNSVDVFELLKESHDNYDLVISDVSMPTMTGVQLVSKLRSLTINIPIILTSGYTDKVTDKILSELNVIKLLNKPYTMKELNQAIALAF